MPVQARVKYSISVAANGACAASMYDSTLPCIMMTSIIIRKRVASMRVRSEYGIKIGFAKMSFLYFSAKIYNNNDSGKFPSVPVSRR